MKQRDAKQQRKARTTRRNAVESVRKQARAITDKARAELASIEKKAKKDAACVPFTR